MQKENDPSLVKKEWSDVRDLISTIDKNLTKIIDDISPSSDLSFYVANYPYGEMIVENGVFQIPNNHGQVVPLNHASIASSVKEDLGYNKMLSTGLVTKNSIETFFNMHSHPIPISLYGVGEFLALWHLLEGSNTYQSGPLWNISSGARSVYMLPKITDKSSYKALKKKYHLKFVPKSLKEHWQTFSHLSRHPEFDEPWSSQIIFFSKEWFSRKDDQAFSALSSYFYQLVWKSSSFRRNQFIVDYACSLAQQKRNLKPNPYLVDTAKYLLALGDGTVPGLAPAINSNALPIKGIQKAFIEDYGIKKYTPNVVHPHHFSLKEKRPVYYSLEVPLTTSFSPRSSRMASKMSDMRELKYITEVIMMELIRESLLVEDTPLLNLAKNVMYGFYHYDNDQHGEVKNISELIGIDHAFSYIFDKKHEYQFPEFSPLFRGCISIRKAD